MQIFFEMSITEMKIKNLTSRCAVLLVAFLLTAVMAGAQEERLMDFQNTYSKLQAQYQQLMREGNHDDAVAPLMTLICILDTTTIHLVTPIPEAALTEQKGLLLYDLACCYTLMGQKKQALLTLEHSVDCGYRDYHNMVNDNDLRSLRKDGKYQALLARVQERLPISVLKRSAPYAREANRQNDDAPLFAYQPKESMNLRMVRDYFNLDSVAGQGDELSRIINLLHFAHDKIRHDGSNRAFVEMDAIDIYNYCKATGKGVNCRQLAISLCEMYLSLGIPARYVTCMPADPNDYECHVIDAVWSDGLQKWLYIDPTMDAWVTDESGTMLSIAEVRERLRNDMPLQLCETANWNHETPQTKENYLDYYMSKNLYYFVCKRVNRFNAESMYRDHDPKDDIQLVPVGYVSESQHCEAIHDPDVFWARP